MRESESIEDLQHCRNVIDAPVSSGASAEILPMPLPFPGVEVGVSDVALNMIERLSMKWASRLIAYFNASVLQGAEFKGISEFATTLLSTDHLYFARLLVEECRPAMQTSPAPPDQACEIRRIGPAAVFQQLWWIQGI